MPQIWNLFEGSLHLKVGCYKNYCFNNGIVIFFIKQTELNSFDFDYIGAAVLIWGGAY